MRIQPLSFRAIESVSVPENAHKILALLLLTPLDFAEMASDRLPRGLATFGASPARAQQTTMGTSCSFPRLGLRQLFATIGQFYIS